MRIRSDARPRILRGRDFAETDTDRAPRVAIVSERLARRLWPGEDPLGRRIHAPGVVDVADIPMSQRWPAVVGIVDDVRYRGLTDPRFDLYVPYLQHAGLLVKHLMVRTSGDPSALVGAIRQQARMLESTALVENVTTMDHIVARATAPWRFSAVTLALLGVVALALASLGIYAVASQAVVERTREIGVRLAVGALPRQIAALVLGDGLRLTLMGIAAGVTIGIGAGRILTGLLYEVRPADPLTLAGIAVLFIVVSTAAILIPARRATCVDPVVVLREQ